MKLLDESRRGNRSLIRNSRYFERTVIESDRLKSVDVLEASLASASTKFHNEISFLSTHHQRYFPQLFQSQGSQSQSKGFCALPVTLANGGAVLKGNYDSLRAARQISLNRDID
jgi:hypothetical protein